MTNNSRSELRSMLRAGRSMDYVDRAAREGWISQFARDRYARLWAVSTATEHPYTRGWSITHWINRREHVSAAVKAFAQTPWIGRAAYTKGKVVMRCPSESTGLKTRAMRLAEAFGGKWVHRYNGYVMAPTRANEALRLWRLGYDANIKMFTYDKRKTAELLIAPRKPESALCAGTPVPDGDSDGEHAFNANGVCMACGVKDKRG